MLITYKLNVYIIKHNIISIIISMNTEKLTAFFSLYSHEEIIFMINRKIIISCYSIIDRALQYGRARFISFIAKLMPNEIIVIGYDYPTYGNRYDMLECFRIILKHNNSIKCNLIWHNSLRYKWIVACIAA